MLEETLISTDIVSSLPRNDIIFYRFYSHVRSAFILCRLNLALCSSSHYVQIIFIVAFHLIMHMIVSGSYGNVKERARPVMFNACFVKCISCSLVAGYLVDWH